MNNSILINLIPYRDEVRTNQLKMLVLVVLGILLLSGVFYYGVYSVYRNRLSGEQQTVSSLQSTVHQLNTKITSIIALRKKRDALIDREKLITTLQNKRDMVVNIFNALASETPRGVFLSSVEQTKGTIDIHGYAEDNEIIAKFMRNITKSTVFSKPQLYIISTVRQGSENVKQFTLQATIQGMTHSNKTAVHKAVKPVKTLKTGSKS